jgi:hypothetical protein
VQGKRGIPAFGRLVSPVVVLLATWCAAQEPSSAGRAGAEEEGTAKFRAYAKDVADSYELRAGDGGMRKLTLVADPVLRWSNPLGGQRARGEIFLWTDAGLPAAVVSINEFTDAAGRTHGEQEWCYLATGPLIADGPHRWTPATGVLSPQPLSDVDAPADSAARRMLQLRELTARFAGEKTTRAGVKRTLRLLPKPIYRMDGGEFLEGPRLQVRVFQHPSSPLSQKSPLYPTRETLDIRATRLARGLPSRGRSQMPGLLPNLAFGFLACL